MILRISARKREKTGKCANNQLRMAGLVPVNMVMPDKNVSLSLSTPLTEIRKVLNAGAHLIELDIESDSVRQAFVKEVDWESLTGNILHINLIEASKDRAITANVPLVFRGTPVGISAGGVFTVLLDYLEVTGLPQDLPDSLVVEVARLNVDDAVFVSELVVGDKLQIRTKKEQRVCEVHIPARAALPTTEAAEGEELAEGEVPAEGEAVEGAPAPEAEKAEDGKGGKDKGGKDKGGKGKK
ncbi:MAG: 50S ribosomal protein L25 [Candidatus Brocadiia bacterium]